MLLLIFLVEVLRILFLDMGGIEKHDGRQAPRGMRGMDRPLKTILYKFRQTAGMVNVCMGQDDTIDLLWIKQEPAVADQVIIILSLEHPAIQQDRESIFEREQMTAPRDLPCCSAKFDVHRSGLLQGER